MNAFSAGSEKDLSAYSQTFGLVHSQSLLEHGRATCEVLTDLGVHPRWFNFPTLVCVGRVCTDALDASMMVSTKTRSIMEMTLQSSRSRGLASTCRPVDKLPWRPGENLSDKKWLLPRCTSQARREVKHNSNVNDSAVKFPQIQFIHTEMMMDIPVVQQRQVPRCGAARSSSTSTATY